MGAKFCNKSTLIAMATQKDLAGRAFGAKGKSRSRGVFKNFQDF
jgi:hypothetical protein